MGRTKKDNSENLTKAVKQPTFGARVKKLLGGDPAPVEQKPTPKIPVEPEMIIPELVEEKTSFGSRGVEEIIPEPEVVQEVTEQTPPQRPIRWERGGQVRKA